jgi:cytidylate kinase
MATTTRTNDPALPARGPVVVHARAAGAAGGALLGEGAMADRLIITIDGPAGTGKSTVARALAHRLGLDFLDTGAMYRAAAAIAIDAGVGLKDPARLVAEVERRDLHFDFDADPPTLLCAGESIMGRLRDADVTSIVSAVAAIAGLRQEMVRKQRQIGLAHPRLVTEGRDQGSVVFPDADVKFYMHASPRVRAERRAAQLREAGRDADVDRLEREISERDRSDSTRTVGPLTCPADAERIDTSGMPFDQVVDALEAHVKRRLGARAAAGGGGGGGGLGGPRGTRVGPG